MTFCGTLTEKFVCCSWPLRVSEHLSILTTSHSNPINRSHHVLALNASDDAMMSRASLLVSINLIRSESSMTCLRVP